MCLADIGETPYSQSKACGKNYSRQKVKQITEAMKRTIISGETIDDGSEMIQKLKEKFQSTTWRSEQLQVLTVLPKSWSLLNIQQKFGVLKYMAQRLSGIQVPWQDCPPSYGDIDYLLWHIGILSKHAGTCVSELWNMCSLSDPSLSPEL